jgi:Ca-activated chloride channel family protein
VGTPASAVPLEIWGRARRHVACIQLRRSLFVSMEVAMMKRLALVLLLIPAFAAGCAGSSEGGGKWNGPGPAGPGTGAGNAGASTGITGAAGGSGQVPGNTNVSLSGSQDFGYFRRLLDAGQVPRQSDFDASGFFAEHHTALPPPACGERICLQTLLGAMTSLSTDARCTMLQLGLNSPIAANPGNRPPLNLSVVVDVSGSMAAAGKIDFVRQGLGLLIDGLRDGDNLAIVTYSTNVAVPFPMADITLLRAQARTVASGLIAEGSTNLYGGLERGYAEAAGHYDSGRQNRVILLSDGQPTAGIVDTAQIVAMSRARNSDGIGLTTIGLGTDFNAALMRDLALQADGNFYFLEDSAAVGEVFTEELSYFTVPVAFDLRLRLTAGAAYAFGRAYGSPFWKDVTGGGELVIPSVFLAHRESDDDQTPDGGRRGGGSALLVELEPRALSDDGSGVTTAEVGRAELSFREPGTNRVVTETVTIDYPFAPWVTPEQGYFQGSDLAVVQKSFVMLNIYVGIERACRAFHENDDAPGAVAGLRRLLAAVDDYNEEIGDADIASDRALLVQLISVLERNGIPRVEQPARANPWPAD